MNGNATLELYDASGKMLEVFEVDYNIGKKTINMDRYLSGTYFIKVKYEGKDDTDLLKVIKE